MRNWNRVGVETLLKCPFDQTKTLKLNQQTANGLRSDPAMRYPRTRKLSQRRVEQIKQKCIEETASENESLTRSRRTNDQELRCFMEDRISEMENTVNDVTLLLEEKGKVPDKTILMDNSITVTSKVSNGERMVLQSMEKAEDQTLDEFQNQRREPGSSPL